MPSSSSLGEINSKLSSSEAETAMTTSLSSAGITVTEISVEGAEGGGCDGGCVAGIVIGVLVGLALIAVLVIVKLKKKKQAADVTFKGGDDIANAA